MSDNGTQQIDQMTPIAGPTAEQLRAPFSKPLAQIAREHQQQIEESIREFKFNGGK